MDMQERLNEQNLVPNLLDKAYTPEARDTWTKLPREVLARVNYQLGTIHHRRGRFEEARALLEAVPTDSRVYARSRYLLGVVLADPKFPGRPGEAQTLDAAAVAAFQAARDAQGNQLGLDEVKQLALLGLGRLHYGRHEYPQAIAAYEAVPRYGRFWDQALFENGFARFQDEDFGGALGSLQALHAPQFEGAFQPESWILKATVYYYSCLFDEVKTTLAAYEALYEPMAKQLEPFTRDEDPLSAYNLVSAENRRLPGPVYLWIHGNERIQDVMRMVGRWTPSVGGSASGRPAGHGARSGGGVRPGGGARHAHADRRPLRPQPPARGRAEPAHLRGSGGDHPRADGPGREGPLARRCGSEGSAQDPIHLPAEDAGGRVELLEVRGRVLARRDRLLPVHAQARLPGQAPVARAQRLESHTRGGPTRMIAGCRPSVFPTVLGSVRISVGRALLIPTPRFYFGPYLSVGGDGGDGGGQGQLR
ncbi:hypothetical protein ACN28S_17100 [Cystobacter fuscus]